MAQYLFYQSSLGATTVKNVFSDFQTGLAFGGFVVNDSSTTATTFGVQLSYDQGSSFGQTIVINPNEKITLDGLGGFSQVKLVYATQADYRLLVSNNKSNIQ